MVSFAAPFIRRYGPPVFFFACVFLYVRETIVRVVPALAGPSDFLVYQQGAVQVVNGNSPFTAVRYFYPPLLALLLTPIARLDYVVGRWLWFLFSQLCLLGSAWLLWRFLGRDWTAACIIALVWATGGAAFENLYLGQLGPQLLLLFVLAYTRTGWFQGSALGLAAALKVFPGLAAAALLLAPSRRAFVSFIVAAAALSAIPWIIVVAALSGPRKPVGESFVAGTPAILSWSLPSVALRALDPPREGMPFPRNWEIGNDAPSLQLPLRDRVVSLSVAAVTFFGGTALVFFTTRGRLSSAGVPWAMAAFVALSLASLPYAWTHYQLFQYPAVAMLLCYLWRSRRWGLGAFVLVCGALLYPLPVAVLRRYYEQRGGSWAPAAPVTLFFWTSVAPLASLALFGVLNRMKNESYLMDSRR